MPTPRFERVAIIGTGLMGGSLALALREHDLAGRVVGCARTQVTVDSALARGAIVEGTTDPAVAVRGADFVVLAAPVRTIIEQMPVIAPHLRPDALITDLGSTKTAIIAAAVQHLSQVQYVPGHPMAGTEHEGIAAARADLFEGEVWLFTPTATTDRAALARVQGLAQAVGSRVRELPAELHDELVAAVSHIPYLLSIALVRATTNEPRDGVRPTDLAGPAYRGSVRLAVSNAEMWGDILSTNRPAIAAALRRYRAELDALAALVAGGDDAALRAALADAVQRRRALDLP